MNKQMTKVLIVDCEEELRREAALWFGGMAAELVAKRSTQIAVTDELLPSLERFRTMALNCSLIKANRTEPFFDLSSPS